MTHTKAVVLESVGHHPPFSESKPLLVEEVELVSPGPGETLVRIDAAGLCHSDLAVVDGTRPWPMPMVLGHEAAGTVEATGPGVDTVEEGDRVVFTYVPSCGMCPTCVGGRPVLCPSAQVANREGRLTTGNRPFRRAGEPLNTHLGVAAFAERTVVSERSVIPIPGDVPAHVAAVFGCAVITGVGSVLNTAQVKEGQSLAVFGLGGVGLSVVMGAVLAGAHPIVAVDRVPSKLEHARGLGATELVDASSVDPVQAIRDLTGGGVDYAFEAVGSAEVLKSCYLAAAPGGSAISIGLAPTDRDISIKAISLVGQEKTLRGSYMGSARPRFDIPRLIGLWKAGKLPVDKLITRRGIRVDDVNQALDRLASGEEIRQIVEP